jgi:hypothetical protein
MYRLAIGIVGAGAGAMALSAQNALPETFPEVAQFSASPPPVVRLETVRALRDLVKKYSQGETAVCSVPLLEVPVAKNAEQMPVLRPRAGNFDRTFSVKLPAPPCQENQR